jgi:hypothetical protein
MSFVTVEGKVNKKPVKFRDLVNSRKTTLEAAAGADPMQQG